MSRALTIIIVPPIKFVKESKQVSIAHYTKLSNKYNRFKFFLGERIILLGIQY